MEAHGILLVEDNADDEALAIRALKKAGVTEQICVARDGVEALDFLYGEQATKNPIKLKVILLDLKLPRMDGLDVIREIRKKHTNYQLPIVVLTSSDEQSDIHNCYELGANSYICKPIDFSSFTHAVQQLANYWLHLNQSSHAG